MSNIYCSQCGTKHVLGAKFCMSCGNALAGGVNNTPQRLQPRQAVVQSDYDEDGIPTTFRKPARLSYEVEKGGKNKFSVNEIISQPPSNDKFERPTVKAPTMTKEEYLSQSLKECSSAREFKEINE